MDGSFSGPLSHRRQGIAQGGTTMNSELLTMVAREVLSWPGVSKETGGGGRGRGRPWVPPATVFRFGRRQIGHIHDTGVADLAFPRETHDQLISDGRAKPHGAGFPGVVR